MKSGRSVLSPGGSMLLKPHLVSCAGMQKIYVVLWIPLV